MLLRLTSSSELPVSVAELKDHLSINTDDIDSLLESYILTATSYVESAIDVCLMVQQWEEWYDCFADDDRITLNKRPVVSIDQIKYFDEDNEVQFLDLDLIHAVSPSFLPSFIQLRDGESWPSTYTRPDAVQIRYTAGYSAEGSSASGEVPEMLRQAIRLLAGSYYSNREQESPGGTISQIQYGVDALLSQLDPTRGW